MNREIAILLTCCFLGGCGKPDSLSNEDLTNNDCLSADFLCIRVENTSDIDFDSFEVHFPDQVEKFGGLGTGQISAYRKIDRAYRYAYTEAFSGGRRFVLQPIDFVGERFVRPGIYTYQYSATVLEEPWVKGDWVLHGSLHVKLKVD